MSKKKKKGELHFKLRTALGCFDLVSFTSDSLVLLIMEEFGVWHDVAIAVSTRYKQFVKRSAAASFERLTVPQTPQNSALCLNR